MKLGKGQWAHVGNGATAQAHNVDRVFFRTAASTAVQLSPSCESAMGPVHPSVASSQGDVTVTKEDLYQRVTDTIVAELEKGVAPWVRPWKTLDARFGGGPFNGYTARGYRGINVWLLLIAAAERGYQDPRWFTYRQAQTLGAQVKRGEKSVTVIFWKQSAFKEKDDGTGEMVERKVPLLRSYNLFNAEQCSGVPQLPGMESTKPELRYEQAQALFTKHGVDVRHGGDKAFFVPSMDFIQVPRVEAFESEEHYWGVMLHELTHWTGHEKRLSRDLSGRFGSQAYAAEELVAEMGSAFLCAYLGVAGQLRHPEYVGNWLTVLKDDKRAVFKASSLAQAAADYVLGHTVEESESPDVDLGAQATA